MKAVGCQPWREGSRVRANKSIEAENGGVDPNREGRVNGSEARSRSFDNADHTGQDSREIVEYRRVEPLGPLLHR